MKNNYYSKIIISCLLILFVSSCDNPESDNICKFMNSEINIPQEKMLRRQCSKYQLIADSLKTHSLKIVYFIDRLNCQTCRFSKNARYEKQYRNILQKNNVDIVYVVETESANVETTYSFMCNARLEGTVYLDTCNAFVNTNPHMNNSLFHSFVLNKDGKVIMIGDPFANQRMNMLFQKVLTNYNK